MIVNISCNLLRPQFLLVHELIIEVVEEREAFNVRHKFLILAILLYFLMILTI